MVEGVRISYVPAELADGTSIAQSTAIPDAWPAALATYLGTQEPLNRPAARSVFRTG